MKRIVKIVLEGFQSHLQTELDLSPGVNIVFGPTDAGKSAILRAIRWVYRNRPRGDAFINDTYKEQGKPCRVTLYFDDQTSIVREKGKGVNRYTLSNRAEPFDNFRDDPPEEVLAFLEARTTYDWKQFDVDLNFGGQFAPAFLLSSPARVPAILFGQLIGLEDIDKAAKLTGGQKREYQTRLTEAAATIAQLEGRLKALPNLAAADALLEQASEIHLTKWAPLENDIHKLRELGGGIIDRSSLISKAEEKLELFRFVPDSDVLVSNLEQIVQHRGTLDQLTRDIAATNDYIAAHTSSLAESDLLISSLTEELERTLQEMEVCPYSGGELFEMCKQRLKE